MYIINDFNQKETIILIIRILHFKQEQKDSRPL